jgi:membrane protein DedA with SNARE-associated domain
MLGWISDIISGLGYGGIVLLMFLEGTCSPIPAEVVMPLAGFAAARGDLSLVGVILAGMVGSVLGALPWYFAARLFGKKRLEAWADRHGRWVTVSSGQIDKALDWFDRHGDKTVFFGRLVPTVRTVISLAAGFVCMNLARFLIYSAAGTLLWSALLSWAGYLLQSRYHKVADLVGPVSSAIVVVIVLAYLYRVITYHPPGGSRR